MFACCQNDIRLYNGNCTAVQRPLKTVPHALYFSHLHKRVPHNHLQRDQLKTEPSLMPSLTALHLLIQHLILYNTPHAFFLHELQLSDLISLEMKQLEILF